MAFLLFEQELISLDDEIDEGLHRCSPSICYVARKDTSALPATFSSSAKPTILTSCCWKEVVLATVTNWHHHHPPGPLLEPLVFSASTLTDPLQSILHTSGKDLLKRQIALVTLLLSNFKWLPIAPRTKSKILKMSYKVMAWALLSPLILPPTLYQATLGFLAVPQILHAPCNGHTYCALWQEYPSYHFILTHPSFSAYSCHLHRNQQIQPTTCFYIACKWKIF